MSKKTSGKKQTDSSNLKQKKEPIITENQSNRSFTMLSQLIKSLKPVNFRELAKLSAGENLTQRHLVVYTVKELLRFAKENSWNMCQHNGFVYIYNGEYWNKIDDKYFVKFLGSAAKRMGWEESYSDYYKNKKELFQQFMSEANLPSPNANTKKVLINLENGTYEVSDNGGKLRAFDPNDFLTYQLPFDYDPKAEAPLFQKYLNRILPDKELQNVLAEFAGYVFIPTESLKLEKVLLLYGTGANGKSVFFDILRALVGEPNFSAFSLQSLTNENGYFRHQLADKLLNYATEISGRIETSYFKTLASGEPIEARLPYRKPVMIYNYARLIFNVNELPADVEHTEGYFRRFIIIPFDQKIPEEEQDKQLASKIIQNELPGVFNWVLAGLQRLQAQGTFSASDVIASEIESYRTESDSVALFLNDFYYKTSTTEYVLQKDMYDEYKNYVRENGYRALSNIKFGKRLEILGYVRDDKSAGKIVFAQKTNKATLNFQYKM